MKADCKRKKRWEKHKKQKLKPPQGLQQKNSDYTDTKNWSQGNNIQETEKEEVIKSLSRNAKREGILICWVNDTEL